VAQDDPADRVKEKPCFPSRRACVCPYRARLGFARLEASAAYLGREARMRAIASRYSRFFSSRLSTRPLICAATTTRSTEFGKNANTVKLAK
jgi:hypothetical protein